VTPWVVWMLTGLGLGAAVVRRRSVASGLVASQTLGVAAGAVWLIPGRSTEFAVAAVILSVIRGGPPVVDRGRPHPGDAPRP
jgi:hypothetical protein